MPRKEIAVGAGPCGSLEPVKKKRKFEYDSVREDSSVARKRVGCQEPNAIEKGDGQQTGTGGNGEKEDGMLVDECSGTEEAQVANLTKALTQQCLR